LVIADFNFKDIAGLRTQDKLCIFFIILFTADNTNGNEDCQ
jgi:hypothetical protein